MSAIAHGWHPPQKHAPSLAVAKEFHEADKREGKYEHATGYAEGGKVSTLGRILDVIAKRYGAVDEGMHGENSPQYMAMLQAHGWNPKVTKKDWDIFDTLAAGPSAYQTDDIKPYLADLADKYGLTLQHPLQTHRGMVLPPDKMAAIAPGSRITSPLVQSVSTDKDVANEFANNYHWSDDHGPLLMDIHHSTGAPLLPQPSSGQSELLLPPGSKGALNILGADDSKIQRYDHRGVPLGADDGKIAIASHTGFAEGGSVPDNMTQKGLDLISHAADRATSWLMSPGGDMSYKDPHHLAARVAAGLGSQVLGTDPSGRPQLGRTPGLVKEVEAIPAGLADVADALGKIRWTPQGVRDGLAKLHEKYGPDLAPGWSRSADASAEQTHRAVRDAMGLPAPRGLSENLAESGGTMLGQLPIGAARAGESVLAKLGGGAAKLALSPLEYLGPTIRPSAANYGAGTLAGGILGAAGDTGPAPQGLQGHAEGGKVDMGRRLVLKGLAALAATGALGEKIIPKSGLRATEETSKAAALAPVEHISAMTGTPIHPSQELQDYFDTVPTISKSAMEQGEWGMLAPHTKAIQRIIKDVESHSANTGKPIGELYHDYFSTAANAGNQGDTAVGSIINKATKANKMDPEEAYDWMHNALGDHYDVDHTWQAHQTGDFSTGNLLPGHDDSLALGGNPLELDFKHAGRPSPLGVHETPSPLFDEAQANFVKNYKP